MTGHTVAAPVDQLEVKGSLGLLRLLTATRLFWTEQLMMRCKPALSACKPTRLPLGKKGFKQWPLAPDSKYALEALTLDKMVTLYFDGSRMDRHVRQLEHLFLADGSWVQRQMLKRGMARV